MGYVTHACFSVFCVQRGTWHMARGMAAPGTRMGYRTCALPCRPAPLPFHYRCFASMRVSSRPSNDNTANTGGEAHPRGLG